MPLKIKRLTPREGAPLELGHLSVLVGPNNCGKSQTLRDIREFCTSGSTSRLKILTDIDIELPSEAEFRQHVQLGPDQHSVGHVKITGVSCDLQKRHDFSAGESWLAERYASLGNAQLRGQLLQHTGTFLIAHLDAEGRFKLAAPSDTYDTRSEVPSNAMQAFFSERGRALDELRKAFRDAFGTDIALDWAAMKRLYLKVGESFGEIPETLEELDRLLRNSPELAQQGDGYKSFAGVAIAMLTFSNRALLLDEPDAFLHPTQARVLGRWIATQSASRPSQVIVTSHSADFLWGVVSAKSGATVVRLNRHGDRTSFHAVPASTTAGLIESPLLSSQPVLDSLFHRGVVVCEGDPDRAVYQTVSHGFLRSDGGDDVLYVHSNGKDAAKTPIELFRVAGIRACAIVDFDVLNSERNLSDLIQALTGNPAEQRVLDLRKKLGEVVENLTDEQLLIALQKAVTSWSENGHADFRRARKSLEQIAKNGSKWSGVKAKGTAFFGSEHQNDLEELLSALSKMGLFVVPVGELESWMQLASSKGRRWNRAALEQLHGGNCPNSLREFVTSVVKFVTTP
jgi:hypothetical protein